MQQKPQMSDETETAAVEKSDFEKCDSAFQQQYLPRCCAQLHCVRDLAVTVGFGFGEQKSASRAAFARFVESQQAVEILSGHWKEFA